MVGEGGGGQGPQGAGQAAGRSLHRGPPPPLGHPSEDPKFPKVPWPSPDLCPACHEEIKGLGTWNEGQVLLFLKQHYGRDNLVDTHSADLGGPGEGAPAPGEKQEGSQAPPEQPPADHGAESLRPPSLLPPRAHLSERSQPGLDLLLGSRAGGEGRRGSPSTPLLSFYTPSLR